MTLLLTIFLLGLFSGKLILFLSPTLINNVVIISATIVGESLPEFIWDDSKLSRSGIPLLHFHFPSLKSRDIAHLEVSNFVEEPFDRDNEATCIFNGQLEYEKDVQVALTGCPGANRFEVKIRNGI